jgi:hypothetical protein
VTGIEGTDKDQAFQARGEAASLGGENQGGVRQSGFEGLDGNRMQDILWGEVAFHEFLCHPCAGILFISLCQSNFGIGGAEANMQEDIEAMIIS